MVFELQVRMQKITPRSAVYQYRWTSGGIRLTSACKSIANSSFRLCTKHGSAQENVGTKGVYSIACIVMQHFGNSILITLIAVTFSTAMFESHGKACMPHAIVQAVL